MKDKGSKAVARRSPWQRATLVLVVTWLLPLLILLLVRPESRLFPSQDILLWWPDHGPYAAGMVRAAMAVGLAMGGLTLLTRRLSWWTWMPAGLLALFALGSAGSGTQSTFSLTRTGVTLTQGWPNAQHRAAPFSGIAGIEIECASVRTSRWNTTPGIGYAILLDDGQRIETSGAGPGRSTWSLGQWIQAVGRWDRLSVAQGVQHTRPETPSCLTTLREELDPEAYAAAVHLLTGQPGDGS